MKSMVLGLVLLFAGIPASANDIGAAVYNHTANLSEFQIDADLYLEGAKIEAGHILIGSKDVTLTLLAKDGYGIFQPAYIATLPITKIRTSCGSVVVYASEDERPVDGIFQSLTVIDNRSRKCRDRRDYKTEVGYVTKSVSMKNGKQLTTISSFFGSELSPVGE